MLSDAQIERYSRQIILPEIGGRGQLRLLSTAVAVLAHEPAEPFLVRYLAAAGIGRVHIWTSPSTGDCEDSIRDTANLNADCHLELRNGSAAKWISETPPDVAIVHGADDRQTAAVSAACVDNRKALVWGRVLGASALLAVFDPTTAPGCYECAGASIAAAPTEPLELQSSASALLASLQAAEAVKIALGHASPLAGRLLRIDIAAGSVTPLPVDTGEPCSVCLRGGGS